MSDANHKAKSIFLEALERASPQQRAAFVEEACAGDAELHRRVATLLRAHDSNDPLLDHAAVEHLAADTIDGSTMTDEQVADDVLDFLAPSQKPGSLGRLAHYEVMQVIGRGGMGVVLRGFDEKLHRIVAIKMLSPHLAANGSARQRFVREARAAAAVTHENVIDIHGVEDTGPAPYIVMQCIDGKTLQDKLNAGGALELKPILRIGLQIAEGLAAAHKQGLIHRDIKPANILLENGVERVRITDFGLARLADDASLTQSGCVAGTPLYMSPEQARDEKVDARSDLFSLGSVLYAICAGHPPFRASSSLAILKRVCEETPRPLREINPAIPEWLQTLVARLQAKDPADRFASAAEVAALLSRRLAQLQTDGDFSDTKTPAAVRTQQVRRPPTTRSLIAASIVGVLLIAVLSVGGWFLANSWWPGASGTKTAGTATTGSPTTGTTTAGNSQPATSPAAAAPAGPIALKLSHPPLSKHTNGPLTVAFSPDGKVLASGGKDRQIYLWDTTTWQARGPLQGHAGDVSDLAFSPDSRRLASVTSVKDKCVVRLWNVETAEMTELGTESSGIWDVEFSPDGQTLVCGGWARVVHVMDAATGIDRLAIPNVQKFMLRALSLSSPDGRVIATGGEGPARLWDASTGEEIVTKFPLPESMYPVFLPGGKGLAGWTYREGLVTVCELPSGKLRRDWRAHPQIEGLAASPDGRFLASVGKGVARVWSTEDFSEVARATGHEGTVYAAAFSPDGKLLATAGRDDLTIRIWDLPEVCHVRK
jgi:serine/threonine protein kinase